MSTGKDIVYIDKTKIKAVKMLIELEKKQRKLRKDDLHCTITELIGVESQIKILKELLNIK